MMKSLLLLLTAVTLALGLGGCNTGGGDTSPQPINPPGSGGRGDSPGQHAASQSAR